jgi:hypothetical protein
MTEKKSEKKSKKKHKTKSMHVRKADNGGFIARHDGILPGEDGVMPPEQEHVLPDIEALKQHMGDHMGDDEAAEGEKM